MGQTILFIPGLTTGLHLAIVSLYLFSWDSKNSQRRGHPLLALLVLVPYIMGIVLL